MLTPNAVQRIIQQDDTLKSPVLQVTQVKEINERWKIELSDGVNTVTGMLAKQNHHLVTNGTIQEGVILALDEYVCNDLRGRYVVIILEVRAQGKQPLIGNPNPASGGGDKTSRPNDQQQPQQQSAPQLLRPQSGTARQYGQQPQGAVPMQLSSPEGKVKPEPTQRQFAGRGPVAQQPQMQMANGMERIIPINGVNPYQNKWTIKARVVSKTDIRKWDKGPNNKGQLFSVTLVDQAGTEIRATFFRDAVDKFYDMLQVDNVFTFSGGRAKLANKDFSSVKNDFELTFDANSIIRHVSDDQSIQAVSLQRVPISKISEVPANATCDVLGIAVEVGDIQQFTSKAGKELTKLEVTLIDESRATIRCTLWGERAMGFKAKIQELRDPIIAVKNARVSDWGGRTLGTGSGSQILIEPDLPEKGPLRSWYENGGAAEGAQSLSGSGAGGGVASAPKSIFERHTLKSIKDLGVGRDKEKGDFIEVKASITYINNEKMWYYACPVEGNNKKVTQNVDGSWTCESTQEHFPNKENRYILRTAISDYSGSSYCSLFNDQAAAMLKYSADDLEKIKDENEAAFARIVNEAMFQTFVIKLKVKEEEYNGEKQIKCTATTVSPVDWAKECGELIKAIESYM